MTKQRRRMSRYVAVCVGAVVALVAAFLGAAPAQSSSAHSFDWMPDTGAHTYCFGSSFEDWKPWGTAAMENLEAQTIVDTVYFSSCADSTIDARWVLFYEDDVYGEWDCADGQSTIVNGQWVCKSAFLMLNQTDIRTSPTPGNQATKTACHELGHGVGLAHYDNASDSAYPGASSCLRSGEWLTTWGTGWNQYAAHHVSGHINPWFS